MGTILVLVFSRVAGRSTSHTAPRSPRLEIRTAAEQTSPTDHREPGRKLADLLAGNPVAVTIETRRVARLSLV
ncbi:Uncharacterised protein [Mycobacteroides abscessus subsp. abscessus]|nr:Uncharacterised protein [Mycobacteroides abscessus subsp. abscessus]